MFQAQIDRQAVIHDMYQNTCHKTLCLIIKPGKQETDEASTYYLEPDQMKDTKYQPEKQDSLVGYICEAVLGNGTTESSSSSTGPKTEIQRIPSQTGLRYIKCLIQQIG